VRRPLFVLVLALTLAGTFPTSGLARHPVPAPKPRPHAPKVRRLAREVADYARRQLGVPYRYGGSSPSTGFDCSGLVYAAYRSIGRTIPRSSWEQLRAGRPGHFGDVRPGDLLFTEGGGHVQLVVSRTAAISAPQTGERVKYVPLPALHGRFAGARRLLD
jgi:peptidoglycan DL-endopeptidase CwlO